MYDSNKYCSEILNNVEAEAEAEAEVEAEEEAEAEAETVAEAEVVPSKMVEAEAEAEAMLFEIFERKLSIFNYANCKQKRKRSKNLPLLHL